MNRCLWIAAALLLALAGCATEAAFKATMESWVGQSEERLIGQLGPPWKSYTFDDGSKNASYLLFNHYDILGRSFCEVDFRIREGRVQSYAYRGNTCRARPKPTF